MPERISTSRARISVSSGRPVQRHTGGRVADVVAHGEVVEREIVVRALRGRRRRQDDVGVPGGLVEVGVDADHEPERRRAPCRADPPSGADRTGLPATVISARICPSPGVSISSASAASGSSPSPRDGPRPGCASGRSRSRVPGSGGRGAGAVGPSGNIAPPGRSRFPVRTLSTSTSQLASVPNSTVQVPIRPYTAAVGAAASSRASARISSALTPQCVADALRGEVLRQVRGRRRGR